MFISKISHQVHQWSILTCFDRLLRCISETKLRFPHFWHWNRAKKQAGMKVVAYYRLRVYKIGHIPGQ